MKKTITTARQSVKKHVEYPGVLGNGSGNPYAYKSHYWVRFTIGVDADGLIKYTSARPIRYAGEGSFPGREGVEVLIRIDPYDDVETISRIMPDYTTDEDANYDSRLSNSSDAITKWWDAKNLIRLLARTVGNGTAQVTIRENPFHVDDYGDWSTFTATLPDQQPDLSSLIPIADYHRLAVVFFDFLNNTYLVTTSTTQLMTSDLDSTDYDECFAQLTHNEFKPLVSILLANGATELKPSDVIEDLRTWMPTPRIYGFPNPLPVDKGLYIRSTHQVFLPELTVLGELTVAGDLIISGETEVIQKDEITTPTLSVTDTERVKTQVWESNTATEAITAVGGITASRTLLRIAGSGGPVDITANPQIADGIDGQILILQGSSDTNTVTIDDGTGVHLHGGPITLADHEIIGMAYEKSDDAWFEMFRNVPASEKTWPFGSPAGSSGVFYTGGYYVFSGANNDFSPSINWGTANAAYGAHFFVVLGAVAVDEITITITGTSITDAGVRDASPDTETIVIPNTTAANTYYETSKKWIGQIAVETTAGTAKDCNYGWSKYWDSNNTKFKIVGAEALFMGGANDSGANILIRHHKTTGWTYNAGADPTPPAALADMQTDYNTEYQVKDGQEGAWKRSNLSTVIDGSASEGIIIERLTTANRTFEPGLCSMMIRVVPQ